MPLYMIERGFAEQLEMSEEDVRLIEEINCGEGLRGLFSFLSADRRRTYCLYEAPSPEAILAAARRANVPADEIVEVSAATPQFAGRLRDWADAVGGSPSTRRSSRPRVCGAKRRAASTRKTIPPLRLDSSRW